MKRLKGVFVGRTATIVGKGPSLLRLTADDFGDGPVVALNHAILAVRRLDLPHPTYLMQKDGCQPHGTDARIPLGCVCPSERVVPPIEPETVILSAAESGRCFPVYPHRIVVDLERELGIPWYTMSAVVAIRLVNWMGCRSVRMLGMDEWTTGDTRRVDDGVTIIPGSRGYRSAAQQVVAFARETRLALEWVTP